MIRWYFFVKYITYCLEWGDQLPIRWQLPGNNSQYLPIVEEKVWLTVYVLNCFKEMVGMMVERAVHCTYYEKTTIFDHFELKKSMFTLSVEP